MSKPDRTADSPALPFRPDRDGAKKAASRAFDRAVRASGYTNAQVGAMLGIDERLVRRMRSDDPADLGAVPSAAALILADHELGERFLAELLIERRKVHGVPSAPITLNDAVTAVAESGASVAALSIDCARHGMPGPRLPELDAAIADHMRECEAARARIQQESKR